jgi:uncharacterized protein YkwD
MQSQTTLRRRRAMVAVCLGLALAVGALAPVSPGLAAPTSVSSTNEGAFLTKLNQERVARGLPAMILDNPLAATARDWSATMSARNQLAHDPGLVADVAAVEPGWRGVAENVGVGYSVQQLHDAFMGSSGHRANVLGNYNRVGIGVAMNGTKLWVTVRFLRGPAITGTTGLGPPPPPPGVPTALHGDFNGDGRDDLLTYGPGSTTDELWFGNADGTLTKRSVSVNGQYRPVAGDFDGDGKAEILWYAPGGTQDYLWRWNGSGWTSSGTTINGTYKPLVGDFDGDTIDDILWYAPGSAGDYYWYGNSDRSFTSVPTKINGIYQPLVGNLDGTFGDDLFWYAAGSTADFIWYSTGRRGGYAVSTTTVNGIYTPFVGDFDGSSTDDLFWYAAGSASDFVWFTSTTKGEYRGVPRTINRSYLPAAGDFDGDQDDDIVWFSPASAAGDLVWWSTSDTTSYASASVTSG